MYMHSFLTWVLGYSKQPTSRNVRLTPRK